ncbi:DUF2513 domain-containing protein [Paenibacillus sp. GXUN7292]|uniref:DUF2513 domain-containing protein n=1 Tax=Paenibacillus sp. GXUN7292 TaxID=3422499 RepID=UPI003D7CBA9A
MKLNHDCVRDILLTIESELDVDGFMLSTKLQEHDNLAKYSYKEILYCSIRLREAGFIETIGTDITSSVGRILKIRGLTYDGHLFLDNVRDNSRWSKVKETAKSSGVVAINLLAALAETYAKKALGLD